MDVIGDSFVPVRNSGTDSTLKVRSTEVTVDKTGSRSTLDVHAREEVEVHNVGEGSQITGT